jgi:WD40 repeat protein
MVDVYLVYHPYDSAFADALADHLQARGAVVTQRLLPIEEKFTATLGKAIEAAEGVVLLLSPHAAESVWVSAQIAWAVYANKPIVPVILAPTSVLSFPFLIDAAQVDLTQQSPEKALYTLAVLLGLDESDSVVPTPLPAYQSPKTSFAPEPPLAPHFDTPDVEALFFAAAEFANTHAERALLLYRAVLTIDPTYAGGAAQTFVTSETERLKPIWLRRLGEEADAAIKKRDWLRAEYLIRDLANLDSQRESPEARAVINGYVNARVKGMIERLRNEAAEDDWTAVETMLTQLGKIDSNESERLRVQIRQERITQLIQVAVEAAKAGGWDRAERYYAQVQVLDEKNNQAPLLREQLDTLKLHWYANDVNAAIDQGNVMRAQRHLEEMRRLNGNPETIEKFEKRLEHARQLPKIKMAQEAISRRAWAEAQRLTAEVLNEMPDYQDAERLHKTAQSNAACEAIYQQAISAAAAGRDGAVATFMAHIASNCPEYGDPEGILNGKPISAVFIRQMRQLKMVKYRHRIGAVKLIDHGLITSWGKSITTQGTIRFLDLDTQRETFAPDAESTNALAVSSDGRWVANGSMDGDVRLWELDEHGRFHSAQQQKLIHAIHSLAFAPDASVLLVGDYEGKIHLLHLPNLETINSGKQQGTVSGLAWSPDGALFVSVGTDALARVWARSGGRKEKSGVGILFNQLLSNTPIIVPELALDTSPRAPNTMHQTTCVAWSPDGNLIAVGSSSRAIHLFSPSGETLGTFTPNNESITALAFSPDGALLASATRHGTLTLWDATVPRSAALIQLNKHHSAVTSLAWSADGALLASGSTDGTVRLWGLGNRAFSEKQKTSD